MSNSIDLAYACYLEHIYDESKMKLLSEHNLPIAGCVPSVLWELFGAILTGRSGAGSIGADLVGWEVKSSIENGSYEYQYHLNTGEFKLLEDCAVNHLFCSYSRTYKDVTIYVAKGAALAVDHFELWLPLYRANYISEKKETRKQRFRKSITHKRVAARGAKVLQIRDGIIAFRDDAIIPKFNEAGK